MNSEEKERPLEELKKRKGDLIEQIRAGRVILRNKNLEVKAIDSVLAQKANGIPPAYTLRKQIEELEFRIATEATSLNKEKALIKELRDLERLHGLAEEIDKLKRNKMGVINSIRNEEQRLNSISEQIDQVNDEISNVYDDLSEKRREQAYNERQRKKKQEKQDRLQKEIEPYTAKREELTLGDICIIKKKNSG